MRGVYLHGFASGPQTAKGVALGAALRARGVVEAWDIPDLEGGDFANLTMDRWLDRAEHAVRAAGPGCILAGSSLGGWGAAVLASRRELAIGAALLIAPAFGFTDRWQDRLGADGLDRWRRDGALPFMHHGLGREIPLGVAFLDSCAAVPAWPGAPCCPCAIVHGLEDEVVPVAVSRGWSARFGAVEAHFVHGDHRLTTPRHLDLMVRAVVDLVAAT